MSEDVQRSGAVSGITELRGASPDAIQFHYDKGNEFFQLWLDETMTYSCALWDHPEEELATAQRRKLDYHAKQANAARGSRVLDIGCGWGSALRRLVKHHGVGHAVGLTLSEAQVSWAVDRAVPGMEVRLDSWIDHEPTQPYDAIICIGALEHFARPDQSPEERVKVYRRFFERCRSMLRPGGRLSLQTIAFDLGKYLPDTPLAEVFPESCLPRLSELAAGFDRTFELEILRNDAQHYVRTLDQWIANMESSWDAVVRSSSVEQAETYKRYLQFTAMAFRAKMFNLLRVTLKAHSERKGKARL